MGRKLEERDNQMKIWWDFAGDSDENFNLS
jgi:hypothetical protein